MLIGKQDTNTNSIHVKPFKPCFNYEDGPLCVGVFVCKRPCVLWNWGAVTPLSATSTAKEFSETNANPNSPYGSTLQILT